MLRAIVFGPGTIHITAGVLEHSRTPLVLNSQDVSASQTPRPLRESLGENLLASLFLTNAST